MWEQPFHASRLEICYYPEDVALDSRAHLAFDLIASRRKEWDSNAITSHLTANNVDPSLIEIWSALMSQRYCAQYIQTYIYATCVMVSSTELRSRGTALEARVLFYTGADGDHREGRGLSPHCDHR